MRQLDEQHPAATTLTATAPTATRTRVHRTGPRSGRSLRARLILGDAVAALFGWGITALAMRNHDIQFGVVAFMTAVVLLLCFRQRLYLSRVCAVRAVELALLGRVAFRSGLIGGIVLWQVVGHVQILATITGMTLTFLALAILRSAYRSVLMRARREGRFLRPVVVVGTDEIGIELVEHIGRNPAFGYQVVGVLGAADEYRAASLPVPYLGAVTNTVELARNAGANGTIVSSGAAPLTELNRLMRDLLDSGLHVQITPGLRGFAQHRVTTHDIAYEPLLYVEPVQLSKPQRLVKRGLDMVLAPVALILAAPAIVAIAVAIKLESRGPVFFRQQRVGHHGKTFTIYKFRTMVADAEELSAALAADNLRDGPLFKMENDPRITRVGKLLRATSLDEVPQLFNVIGGSMTLVGPRPALEREVAEFDDELLRRFSVRPGVTGLWQLEARDDPDFEAYRRLDLFYVENWALSLDLAIILGTVADVAIRGVAGITGRSEVN